MNRLRERQSEMLRSGVADSDVGQPHVLAFLFAHDGSDAMRTFRDRFEYFDHRTGDLWDLFLPGYYLAPFTTPTYDDRRVRGQPLWTFNPFGFDVLRRHIEQASRGRWDYSGNTDLVLVGCWLPPSGEPIVDWESTIAGQLSDRGAQVRTRTLGDVIERISRDLERKLEDPAYGISDVTDPMLPVGETATKKVMIGALGSIVASLAMSALGF